MEENPKPRRRWYRFSLRTMLVLVVLVCIYLGWAINWIWQREAFRDKEGIAEFVRSPFEPDWPAPIAIRLLGAQGCYLMHIHTSPQDEKEARRLFPEAKKISLVFEIDYQNTDMARDNEH